MSDDPNYLEAALLRTMTLLASLSTAAEVVYTMRERKAGRDPSAEERADIVMPELRQEIATLKAIIFQLESSLALSDNHDTIPGQVYPAAEPVNRFIDLVRLRKAGAVLHRIHQRLLSLYPAVDESVAEEARLLKNVCDEFSDLDAAAFTDPLVTFVRRARRFARTLERLIGV